jgi:hypothetical protein
MGVRGLSGLRRKVSQMERNLGDNVESAVRDQATSVAADAQRNVATHNTVWSGDLYNSIGVTRGVYRGNGTRYVIEADEPYAAFIEYGTGMRGDSSAPPKFQFDSPNDSDYGFVFANIWSWVQSKPVFFGPRTPNTAAQITETIIEQGTFAHPFMRPAWFTGKPMLVQRAGYAAKRTVRR